MATRRNIVPTAEISIAVTVVDPSSLLFPLFPPFVSVSLSLFIFPFLSFFFLMLPGEPEYVRDERQRLPRRVKALIGPD